jgi:hypothetical protein
LSNLTIQADPAGLISAATIPPRFILGPEVLAALGPTFRFRCLDDLSVDAAPSPVSAASCLRSFPGRITRNTFRLGLSLGQFEDLAVNANPAVPVSAAAGSPRFLFRTEVLAPLGPAFSWSRLDDLSVDAAPSSVSATIRFGSFLGRITRKAFRLSISFRHLDHLSVHANPAEFAARHLRSFSGRKTGKVLRLRFGFRNLNNLSVKADPAKLPRTIFPRFFLGRETSQVSVLGLLLAHLHDLSVLADPAESVLAIPLRFFLGRVTGNVVFLRLKLGYLEHFSLHANPAELAAFF